jgi:ketosteroid isomerase-like protein
VKLDSPRVYSRGARYLTLLSALTLFGCGTAQQAPVDTAAEESAIRKLDEQWAKDANERKTVDAWMAYYTDDAVVLPPNEPTQTTPEGIRKSLDGLLSLPGLQIGWQLTKIEVAKSGDLAYAYGTYDMSFDDKDTRISDKGKILEIWKKQDAVGWKCAADTWNTDMPLAPPPAK